MKKRSLAILLTMAMTIGCLVGCGGDASADNGKTENSEPAESVAEKADDGQETDSSQEIEMEIITVWSDQYHEKELREKQIAEFNEGEGKELGIQIEYEVYGDSYTDTLRIASQAGEAPDLFHADGKWLPEFVESGYVLPIEDLPGSENILNEYKDLVSNQAQVFEGKTYTLPYSMTTYGFVINCDLFEQAGMTEDDYPTTWDEVRDAAAKITEASNGKAYGLGLSSTTWTVSSFYTFGAGENIGHYGYDWSTKQFDYSAFNPLIEAVDQIVADGNAFPGFDGRKVEVGYASSMALVTGVVLAIVSFIYMRFSNKLGHSTE